jgi:hypothetical protein
MSDNNDTFDMDADAVAELKVRCEQLERELIQVKHRADTGIVKAHLQAEATRAGIIDIDGLKMLDVSGVTISEDGEVRGASALMERVRKEKPWLFAKHSTSNTAVVPPAQPPRQKLATEMTDAEYKVAREALIRHRA